ncbi:MAG TPA: hypothetical protein VF688_08640 [Allosphingosinicella sp.]|jgi:hypothetical protein
MLRRFTPLLLTPLLLTPLLASCQPPNLTVRAEFRGNALAFVPARSADSDSAFCWSEATIVDDSLRPVWRFTGPRTGECGKLFPLFYGRAPQGSETAIQAARLEPGRLYLFIGDATAEVSGAFAFTQAGSARIIHNVDPRSPAAETLRRRWWKQRDSAGIDDRPPAPAEDAH